MTSSRIVRLNRTIKAFHYPRINVQPSERNFYSIYLVRKTEKHQFANIDSAVKHYLILFISSLQHPNNAQPPTHTLIQSKKRQKFKRISYELFGLSHFCSNRSRISITSRDTAKVAKTSKVTHTFPS